jgi:5-formaminoimidazole-4-carboxamide-1-beta-D-ribofuranosyl 5'-monophosphate synthetase
MRHFANLYERLWRTNMSTGRRTARMIREAIQQGKLREIVT